MLLGLSPLMTTVQSPPPINGAETWLIETIMKLIVAKSQRKYLDAGCVTFLDRSVSRASPPVSRLSNEPAACMILFASCEGILSHSRYIVVVDTALTGTPNNAAEPA